LLDEISILSAFPVQHQHHLPNSLPCDYIEKFSLPGIVADNESSWRCFFFIEILYHVLGSDSEI